MTHPRILRILAAACAFLIATATAEARDIKVAAIEFAPVSPGFAENLPAMEAKVIEAAKNGARLMVLPEAATTGFLYMTREELARHADTVPGKTTDMLSKITRQYHAYVVTGLYEKDPATGKIYNAAVLVGPDGYIGKYRKHNLAPGEGNLVSPSEGGFPVFDTEIGRIGLIICYDDTQIQNVLTPVLRGADILVQPVGSFKMPSAEPGSDNNHSTLANIATAVSWAGLDTIVSNLTGIEGPGRGLVEFGGGASVFDHDGRRLVSAPVSTWTRRLPPETVYATIDPSRPSEQRTFWLAHRRPELYGDVNSYRYPDDAAANLTPQQISALLLQYAPAPGAVAENAARADSLIGSTAGVFNITVLPFNAFLGKVALTRDTVAQYAEPLGGRSYQLAAGLAAKYETYLLFSMPEKDGSAYYQTSVLFDPRGKQLGLYRKSHLNDAEKTWATAGDDLPVFETPDLGRVAIVMNDEVRIPELAMLYGIDRADLILVPAAYEAKDYSGPVDMPKGTVSDASNRGMTMWYNLAKYAQAYVLVSNAATPSPGGMANSAVYGLAPEVDYDPPRIAPDGEQAFLANFTTHSNPTVYISQEKLIAARRWDQAAPFALDPAGACFREWAAASARGGLCPKASGE